MVRRNNRHLEAHFARRLRRPAHKPPRTRLNLEYLEDRTLLTAGALDPTFNATGTLAIPVNLGGSGDAVANGPYNYTADANVANWPNVIRKAQKLKVTQVLPGHGVPAGPEVLAGEALFMTELHKAVKSAVGQGKKLDEVSLLCNGAGAAAVACLELLVSLGLKKSNTMVCDLSATMPGPW